MLITLPDVLDAAQVRHARGRLQEAGWVDGRLTSGHQSAAVKANLQLPDTDPVARELGDLILASLEGNALFISAALPRVVVPPLFNRYLPGMGFGNHVDNAIRALPGSAARIRTDLSATLFLGEPDSYDGGELLIDDTFGVRRVKLAAGSMVLYPSSSIHRVAPVTRGERLAAFFWIQSLVRRDDRRSLLLDLDTSIQSLQDAVPGHAALTGLTGCYHNLLRDWSEL
jgi:PKHD-type hydroxylase